MTDDEFSVLFGERLSVLLTQSTPDKFCIMVGKSIAYAANAARIDPKHKKDFFELIAANAKYVTEFMENADLWQR